MTLADSPFRRKNPENIQNVRIRRRTGLSVDLKLTPSSGLPAGTKGRFCPTTRGPSLHRGSSRTLLAVSRRGMRMQFNPPTCGSIPPQIGSSTGSGVRVAAIHMAESATGSTAPQRRRRENFVNCCGEPPWDRCAMPGAPVCIRQPAPRRSEAEPWLQTWRDQSVGSRRAAKRYP